MSVATHICNNCFRSPGTNIVTRGNGQKARLCDRCKSKKGPRLYAQVKPAKPATKAAP